MLYLLDANVLITASRQYYAIERVPEFWDWLRHMGEAGRIKIGREMYEEVNEGNDALAKWARRPYVERDLVLDEVVDVDRVRRVVKEGYAPDLTDDEFEKLGRDPFLVAYALVDQRDRSVVTVERSKPKRKRGNRHIPDVCSDLGVPCCDTFELTTALDFRTDWKGKGK